MKDDSNATPTQIQELQQKVSFLEAQLQDMSDVVYQQQKTLDQHRRTIQALTARFQQAAELLPGLASQAPHDAPPPHY
ncbi:SlyX family protein [Spirochaeta lutea]|uniref:SlyX family protein n=1 Tax=Spirochaeta lutea TaxID=1480694 RepID=A0A098R1L4_9SPIO|nr:SlyX family protein [Spirochaeta lutea]KGE73834.1 hypothetical protein DC28_01050 [Spirochaeta lutea]